MNNSTRLIRIESSIHNNISPFRPLTTRDRHYSVHHENPEINYVIEENCPFCKKERMNNYSNNRHTNNRPLIQINNWREYFNNLNQHNRITRPYSQLYVREDFLRDDQQVQEYYDVPISVSLKQLNRGSRVRKIILVDTLGHKSSFCTICQENFICGEIIRHLKTPCDHFYHLDCLDQWLESNHKCPLCRKDIRELK